MRFCAPSKARTRSLDGGQHRGGLASGITFCSLDTLSSDLTAYLEDLKLEGDEEGSMHESAEFASASEGGD
jgi:hypothetical protein